MRLRFTRRQMLAALSTAAATAGAAVWVRLRKTTPRAGRWASRATPEIDPWTALIIALGPWAEADRLRHIGWDLGAEALALDLAERLDSPLLLATYSRLLLDLNRATDAHDCIAARSEDIDVPGNHLPESVARVATLKADLQRRFHAGPPLRLLPS